MFVEADLLPLVGLTNSIPSILKFLDSKLVVEMSLAKVVVFDVVFVTVDLQVAVLGE